MARCAIFAGNEITQCTRGVSGCVCVNDRLDALKDLVDALERTNWSSWQTTASFDKQLERAQELLMLGKNQ